MLVWTVQRVLKDDALARKGLDKLKDVLAVFISNRQQFPLVYESTYTPHGRHPKSLLDG